MNCICNLFNNESLIWIIIIAALLLSCYGNGGYAGGGEGKACIQMGAKFLGKCRGEKGIGD